jgi:GNAT superfamily N-acetyltransferase
MDAELIAAIELAERDGTLDFMRAAPPELAAEQGIGGELVAGAACLRCRGMAGNRMFNHVLGLGVEQPAGRAAIDAVAAVYEPGDVWYAAAADAEVGASLEAAGFEPDYAWMKFVRHADASAQAPTDLRVEEIGPEHGAAMGALCATAFELPDWTAGWIGALAGREGWHCYVAFDGDEPAGTGSIYLRGRAGWLGFAGTDPRFRGRGAQSALLAARVRRAAEAGCEVVTTETGEQVEGRPSRSYRNILRAGFREAYLRPNLRANLKGSDPFRFSRPGAPGQSRGCKTCLCGPWCASS